MVNKNNTEKGALRLKVAKGATTRLASMEREASVLAANFARLIAEFALVAEQAQVPVDKAYGLLVNLTPILGAFESCVRTTRYEADTKLETKGEGK